jgi:hypothetical protein
MRCRQQDLQSRVNHSGKFRHDANAHRLSAYETIDIDRGTHKLERSIKKGAKYQIVPIDGLLELTFEFKRKKSFPTGEIALRIGIGLILIVHAVGSNTRKVSDAHKEFAFILLVLQLNRLSIYIDHSMILFWFEICRCGGNSEARLLYHISFYRKTVFGFYFTWRFRYDFKRLCLIFFVIAQISSNGKKSA